MAYPSHKMQRLGTLLDEVAGNAAAASRTFEIDCTVFDQVGLTVVYTQSAGTAVTIQLYRSYDGGTTWGRIQAGALGASGTDSVSDYTISNAVSGNESYDIGPIDMRLADRLKCVVGVTNGGASDKITVVGGAEVA